MASTTAQDVVNRYIFRACAPIPFAISSPVSSGRCEVTIDVKMYGTTNSSSPLM